MASAEAGPRDPSRAARLFQARKSQERMARRGGTVTPTRDRNEAGDPTGGTEASKPAGSEPEKAPLAPGLYLVATPIGNLGDITLRALETLRACDAIFCEDTRVTSKLTARFGLRRPLMSYHEHNAERTRPEILRRIDRGEAVALVSDAGTPLISDPGFKLVREATARGLTVTALPGPSAVLAALTLSGLPTDRFLFLGFLPNRRNARRAALEEVGGVRATLILFEAAGRLADLLADMAEILGAREAAVAREITKKFEEVRRGSLAELAAQYRAEGAPRGEIVVVVGPPADRDAPSDQEVEALLRAALELGSVREAAASVAEQTGLPRRELYQRALRLAGRR
jgi:16S rRNA (cytidine1402-2'-O)-methyltransferase